MDEDDLKWVANEKKILLFLKQLHENCGFKTTSCRKLNNFSEMQNYALMHREGLKGYEFTIYVQNKKESVLMRTS